MRCCLITASVSSGLGTHGWRGAGVALARIVRFACLLLIKADEEAIGKRLLAVELKAGLLWMFPLMDFRFHWEFYRIPHNYT